VPFIIIIVTMQNRIQVQQSVLNKLELELDRLRLRKRKRHAI